MNAVSKYYEFLLDKTLCDSEIAMKFLIIEAQKR